MRHAKLTDIQSDRRHPSSQFRILKTTFSDPDLIDEATEVYGDWPEIDTPCDKAPAGQCEFSIFDPDVCLWCKKDWS